MGVYLNPGNDMFCETVRGEIYVDKTELIRETNRRLKTPQKFVCISRARRFGKSMAAYMLAAYYGKNCDSKELFAPYKIANCDSYEKYLNKYNYAEYSGFSQYDGICGRYAFLFAEPCDQRTKKAVPGSDLR